MGGHNLADGIADRFGLLLLKLLILVIGHFVQCFCCQDLLVSVDLLTEISCLGCVDGNAALLFLGLFQIRNLGIQLCNALGEGFLLPQRNLFAVEQAGQFLLLFGDAFHHAVLRKIDDFARLVVDLVRKICHRRIAGRLDRLRLVQRSQLLPQLVELIVDHGHGAVLVHRRYLLVHCNLFAIRTVIDHHTAGCL